MKARKIDGEVALVGTDFLPHTYARELMDATPQIAWREANDLVQQVRKIKSARELDCYREGGEIATRAIMRYMEGLTRDSPDGSSQSPKKVTQ